MRFTIALPVLAGFAYALPQGIDFDAFETAAPAIASGPAVTATAENPTTVYDATALQSSVAAAVSTAPVDNSTPTSSSKLCRDANDACGVQPDGYGPAVHNPDTSDHFENSPQLQAYSIFAKTPTSYTKSFYNLNGSTQLSTYMGLYTLQQYNPDLCASQCNQVSGCLAFNLYFRRDPSLNPADACPDPSSTTNIKCTLYGSQISAKSATNVGQYRENFHVVIAGSNGYNKFAAPAAQGGYTGPAALTSAIDATTQSGVSIYIGARFFNQPYDAGVCAALCNATTIDNRAVAQAKYTAAKLTGGSYDGSYQPCNYFNAYILSQNDLAQGLYCSLYTTSVDPSKATVETVQKGFFEYSVSYSYGYSASVQDDGSVANQSIAFGM